MLDCLAGFRPHAGLGRVGGSPVGSDARPRPTETPAHIEERPRVGAASLEFLLQRFRLAG